MSFGFIYKFKTKEMKDMMVKKVVETFFTKATEFAAVSASGSASWWGYCQPEEPEMVQEEDTDNAQ